MSKLICSFCGKDLSLVLQMLTGPGVNICSGCVRLAHDVIMDNYEKRNKELNKDQFDTNMMLRTIRDEILTT